MAAVSDPSAPDWLDDLSFPVGPPHLSMGLRALGDEPWLVADEHRATDLAEKRQLTAERPDEVFAARPGTEVAGAEVLDAVVTWSRAHDLDAPGADEAPAHPLGRAGLLVQEDLCLLVDHGGSWHLDAASLHFPSHWRLADKLGLPLAAVHGPVAHYEDELARKVDTEHARMQPGRPMLRRNWTLHEHDTLFAPVPVGWSDAEVADPHPERWTLRSERQTLLALPSSGSVLFTIRTQQVPLGVLARRPDRAADLAAGLRSLSPELEAYKGLAPVRAPLLTWLDAQTSRSVGDPAR
jgi:hypothetical protein